MASLLSLKNWINTRHVIIDTKPSLLSSNNEKVLKCLGGVQGCLMLLLQTRYILPDQQCNSIKQAISELKLQKTENKLIINENNNKEETVKLTFDKLDSNSLCHITHFLTTFEISVSFKNVCSKFAIIGLDEINKYDVFVTKINNIQYKYKYINQPKLFEELLCDNLHNCITLRVPQNMKTKTMFIRYMNKNNINPLHSAIFETHKNNKNEMVPTVNVTTTMFNELSIVNKNINRKNKYLICEYINEISDIKYEQTNDLLLFIKYFDIFEQQLYVKWLLFNKKNSIKQFVQFIISKLILNSNKNNNQYSKYELTNLKSNLLNKCLFYGQKNDDLTLKSLKLSENQILEDLNIEYLSTIVFQLNPNKLIINYSNLQNEVENKGNFWYNTISNFIESIKQSKTVYIKPYKTTFDEYKQMEETLKTFKILIAPNTTYGVIRKKISHFLNAKNKIKSHNIEIESMEDTFWDTPIPNLDESIIRYDIVLYDVREKHKKCKISMINGDKLMENNNINNILDIGMKSLLNNILIYKDITFKQIFNQWSKQTNIPLQYLIVYYYTERKNKTIRPNCQLKLNLNEEYKNDKNITQQMIKTHTINTKSTQKYIKSIHERIGNILVKKRSFMLFDNRKIATIKNQSVAIDSKRILLALKYFDFFQQKLYFVDWIFINTNTVKFIDIQNYIIKTLIPNAKKERLYFKELNDYISKMNQDKKHETFLFFEEEAVIKDNDDKVIKLHMNNNIDNNYFDGDIFIFQLNPYHSYFNGTNNETLSPQIIKQKSEKKGVYWYDMVNDFMTSQLNMVNIEIKVRENTGWKQQWTNALLLQYKNNNKHVNIDENTRNKITQSEHKWRLEKKTTFGMIRMKSGSYYNINPEYIEIWLPQHKLAYSDSDKWDYGSKGRGKWNDTIESLLSDGPHRWNEQCTLKFEIQTYRMQDFDRMTLYNNTCLNTQAYAMMNHTFSKRIKELAMFNFEIIAPNKARNGCGNMTMSFCKNWTAKQLSNGILKEVIENPIFGYTFFSEIVKYIRENEIDESKSDKYIDDISILKSLSLDRFLICDENVDKLPIQYYMNDKYEMPEHFSQIKYTDFRMQFLAKNDPLVIMNLQNEQKAMEIDMNCKALWVYLEKINAVGGNRYQSKKIRVVLKKGESLKDIIINYLIPYLTLSESFKILNHDKHHNKVADMLIDNILMTHKFKIKGQTNKLTKDEINDSEFAAKLTDKMYLIVWLPRDT